MMNGQNWYRYAFFILLPLTLVIAGFNSQSLGQFVEIMFGLFLCIWAIIAIVGSILEKEMFTLFFGAVGLYFFIPLLVESLS
jgi:hypothetical protein